MTSAPTTVAAPGDAFSLKPLLFTAGVGSLSMMAFVAVVGPMARLLGLQPWHVGAAVTAAGLAWMLMARFWGARSDSAGRRKVLLIALAGFAVSYAALGLFMSAALALVPATIVSFLGMTAARTAAGAFYAAVPPICAAVVADHTPPDRRARAMGAVGAASAMGMVVGPGAAGLLAGWSLSASLIIVSALPVLAFAAVWRFLPADAPHETRRKSTLKLSDPRIRRAVVTAFCAMCGVVVCQVVVGFLALDRFGLSPNAAARAAGVALAVVGVVLFASQMVLRRLSWTPSRFIRIGGSVAAVGFVCAVFAAAPWQLWAAYGVIAAGMGWVYPSQSALAANAVEAHEQGAAAGAVGAAQGLGAVLGPLAGTAAYQAAHGAPYAVSAVMILIAALWPAARAKTG
ncbi:MAG: MFS transporter [Bordetella sp.]|nr:MFS transporter [Bordetella sp.]